MKCLILTTIRAGEKPSWVFTLRLTSLCLQLSHGELIVTTQQFLYQDRLSPLPNLLLTQLHMPVSSPAAFIRSCAKDYHNVDICFPCGGVIGFLPPWGGVQDWESKTKQRYTDEALYSNLSRARGCLWFSQCEHRHN